MAARTVLITGGAGQLGRDLAASFAAAGWEVAAPGRADLDVTDRSTVLAAAGSLRPDVVVHAAAWTAVDDCEADFDRAWRVNALGSRHVAEAARLERAHLVAVSTDYVFDGTKPAPYVEWDPPAPASAYGRSKLGGEDEVLAGCPGSAVVRTAWLSGIHGHNIVRTILRLADDPERALAFVDDQRGSPTTTADLATAIVRLAAERRPGRFHVTNQGATTWFGVARAVLAAAGHDPDRVRPVTTADLDPPRPAPRPANSVLDNAALRLAGLPLLRPWEQALGDLVTAIRAG